MSLEKGEGYISGLMHVNQMIESGMHIKELYKVINEKIEECEYALGECYSNLYEQSYKGIQ